MKEHEKVVLSEEDIRHMLENIFPDWYYLGQSGGKYCFQSKILISKNGGCFERLVVTLPEDCLKNAIRGNKKTIDVLRTYLAVKWEEFIRT